MFFPWEDNLYQSLFAEADKHIAVVRALAAKPAGLTRKEIIAACGLSTGGRAIFTFSFKGIGLRNEGFYRNSNVVQ